MATIPGGVSEEKLSNESRELLVTSNFVGGEVDVQETPGGLIVSGQGGNMVGTGVPENQIVVINNATNQAFQGQLNDGVVSLTVILPPGLNIRTAGPSEPVNANQVASYVNNLIDQALPDNSTADPGLQAYKNSLVTSLADLQNMISGQQVVVRVVSFADTGGGLGGGGLGGGSGAGAATTGTASASNSIVFDAGNSAGQELLVMRLDQIKQGATLELKNVENAMLVGKGTVAVDGTVAARLVGDLANQKITGGAGNDTLVGGGGNDTLVGGAGSDVLGFNNAGHYTIEGFSGAQDKLAFSFDNLQNISQLLTHVTGVKESAGNVTYEFDNGAASITLIGLSADQITADMVKFFL